MLEVVLQIFFILNFCLEKFMFHFLNKIYYKTKIVLQFIEYKMKIVKTAYFNNNFFLNSILCYLFIYIYILNSLS